MHGWSRVVNALVVGCQALTCVSWCRTQSEATNAWVNNTNSAVPVPINLTQTAALGLVVPEMQLHRGHIFTWVRQRKQVNLLLCHIADKKLRSVAFCWLDFASPINLTSFHRSQSAFISMQSAECLPLFLKYVDASGTMRSIGFYFVSDDRKHDPAWVYCALEFLINYCTRCLNLTPVLWKIVSVSSVSL